MTKNWLTGRIIIYELIGFGLVILLVWLEEMEEYISTHSEAFFTHTICPECSKKYFG